MKLDITARDRLKLVFGLSLYPLLGGCTGGEQGQLAPAPTPTASPPPPPPTPTPPPPTSSSLPTTLPTSLQETFEEDFPFGVAVKSNEIEFVSPNERVIRAQFSSITPEFEMKADQIAAGPDNFDFSVADQLVEYAEVNRMEIRGHTLLWHQTTPEYMLSGTRDETREHIEAYIDAVVSRYKGRIPIWDVVNEPTTDDATDASAPYRNDGWYAQTGKDYLDWAFLAARAADPDARLFINDYNTEFPEKRERYLTIIRDLLDRGIPLDGVGHQGHLNVRSEHLELLDAIDAVDALNAGLENQITELEVSTYTDPASCFAAQVNCEPGYMTDLDSVPVDIQRQQIEVYRDIVFGAQERESVTSVTVWGISDATSFANVFPIERPSHTLLFDRDLNPKPPAFGLVDPEFEL